MHSAGHLVACFGIAALLPAQTQWTKASVTPLPSPRSNFDVAQQLDGSVILFGGRLSSGYTDDTWRWDGKKWSQLTLATKPSRRGGHCMAYDKLRRRVVLFSGWNGGVYVPDTWEFDGAKWIKMAPANQPGIRDWSSMAYDIRTRRVILFGGHDWRRANYGDTWAWDGKNWTQLSPKTKPPAGWGHRLIVDESTASVVMIGGLGAGMWRWTGSDWLKLTPAKLPPQRAWPAMAYDRYRGRLVLHGGGFKGKVFTDTWEWNGKTWTQRLTTGGAGVSHCPAFFDRGSNRIALVQGSIGGDRARPANAMWFYGAKNPASYTGFGNGCKGTGGIATLSGTPPWIGEAFTVTVSNLRASGVAVVFLGSSKTRWGTIPLPLDLAPLGAAGCKLYTDPLLPDGLVIQRGSAQRVALVPNLAAFVGVRFFQQAMIPDAGANAFGLVFSNGGEARVGSK